MQPLDETQRAAREQFDRQSARYGRTHILADTSDVAEALGEIVRDAGEALDVATGGGHTAVFLARAGWSVTASDLAPGMLDACARLAAESGVTVRTASHPAEELPYADESFDLVTCRVAAHHFSSPSAFVREVARVLRPGGWFLLIDGTVPDGEREAAEWLHAVEKWRDPSHGRFLPPAEWQGLCGEAGLRVERHSLTPLKQPDLEWYFETAGTSPAGREAVRRLVAEAPQAAREAFRLGEEEGRIVWWWPRLALLARKP